MTPKLLILVLLCLQKFASSIDNPSISNVCSSVECSNSTAPDSACFYNEKGKYFVNVCDQSNDQVCLINQDLETVLLNRSFSKLEQKYFCSEEEPPIALLKMPDESCSLDSECFSQACISSKCQGQSIGQECDEAQGKLCSKGLFCFSNSTVKVCQRQNNIGQSCSESSECTNDAFCLDSTCVKFLSLAKGSKVPGFADGQVNFLCESFLADSEGSCADPPSSELSIDFPEISCEDESDCKGADAKAFSFYNACSCNLGDEAKKYCALPPSHAIYATAKSLFEKLIALNGGCISAFRFDARCGPLKELLEELSYLLTYSRFYQMTIGMAGCLEPILSLPSKERIKGILEKYSQKVENPPQDRNESSSSSSYQNGSSSYRNESSSYQNESNGYQNESSVSRNQSSSYANQSSGYANQSSSSTHNESESFNSSASKKNETNNGTTVFSDQNSEKPDSTLKKELLFLFYSVLGFSILLLICIIFCRYRKRLSKAGQPNLLFRPKAKSVKNEFKMQVDQIIALDEEKHDNIDDSRNEMNLNKKSSKAKKNDFQQLELHEEHNLTAKNVFNIEGEEEGGFTQKKNLDIVLNDSNLSEASELSHKKGENSMSNIWK